METKTELEAQSSTSWGVMVEGRTQWSQAEKVEAQPIAFFRDCRRW